MKSTKAKKPKLFNGYFLISKKIKNNFLNLQLGFFIFLCCFNGQSMESLLEQNQMIQLESHQKKKISGYEHCLENEFMSAILKRDYNGKISTDERIESTNSNIDSNIFFEMLILSELLKMERYCSNIEFRVKFMKDKMKNETYEGILNFIDEIAKTKNQGMCFEILRKKSISRISGTEDGSYKRFQCFAEFIEIYKFEIIKVCFDQDDESFKKYRKVFNLSETLFYETLVVEKDVLFWYQTIKKNQESLPTLSEEATQKCLFFLYNKRYNDRKTSAVMGNYGQTEYDSQTQSMETYTYERDVDRIRLYRWDVDEIRLDSNLVAKTIKIHNHSDDDNILLFLLKKGDKHIVFFNRDPLLYYSFNINGNYCVPSAIKMFRIDAYLFHVENRWKNIKTRFTNLNMGGHDLLSDEEFKKITNDYKTHHRFFSTLITLTLDNGSEQIIENDDDSPQLKEKIQQYKEIRQIIYHNKKLLHDMYIRHVFNKRNELFSDKHNNHFLIDENDSCYIYEKFENGRFLGWRTMTKSLQYNINDEIIKYSMTTENYHSSPNSEIIINNLLLPFQECWNGSDSMAKQKENIGTMLWHILLKRKKKTTDYPKEAIPLFSKIIEDYLQLLSYSDVLIKAVVTGSIYSGINRGYLSELIEVILKYFNYSNLVILKREDCHFLDTANFILENTHIFKNKNIESIIDEALQKIDLDNKPREKIVMGQDIEQKDVDDQSVEQRVVDQKMVIQKSEKKKKKREKNRNNDIANNTFCTIF
jgi:hypothetical protein